MTHRPTTLERAYQLAGSGQFATVSQIKSRLRTEGFSDINGQLYGGAVTAALRKLCEASRPAAGEV
ncbi:MAG: hypothetical protein ACHP84_15985 [Caulobacterales bacterium]|jgi:hypothetical protein